MKTHQYGGVKSVCLLSAVLFLNIFVLKAETHEERATYVESDNCTCGKFALLKSRIVGGSVTDLHEFPMMAALVDGVKARVYCGATIISEQYALTAAHCASKVPNTTALLVGDHDISTNMDTRTAELIPVQHFVTHPLYNRKTQHHDIAIVKLPGNLRLGRAIWPACLPFRYRKVEFADEEVSVLGWGSVEFLGSTSNKLLSVKLRILSVSECLTKYNNTTPQQICSFASEKDACQTDSGGPLFWPEKDRRNILIGIISYGVGCATDMPGVNTRVTEYLDWILDNTPGAKYCSVAT